MGSLLSVIGYGGGKTVATKPVMPHSVDSSAPSIVTTSVVVAVAVASAVAAFVAYRRFFQFPKRPITLTDPDKKVPLKLISMHRISHDTRRFRFALPSSEHVLGLPIGQHIHLIAHVDGKLVIRPYTPVSSDDDPGFVDLVVKVYFANVHPNFPDGGKMTQYLESLKIGDSIDFRGPTGKITYTGNGNITFKPNKKDPPQRKTYKRLGMIAGGSGITPVYQVAHHILMDPNDKTRVSVLYANQTLNDILLHDELDSLAANYPDRFTVHYTLDRPPTGWTHSTGFINERMIQQYLPAPSPTTGILLCGPPPMINYACNPNLDKLGYDPETRYAF